MEFSKIINKNKNKNNTRSPTVLTMPMPGASAMGRLAISPIRRQPTMAPMAVLVMY